MTSEGDGVDGVSVWGPDGGRVRVRVCLNDANLAAAGLADGGGEAGRLEEVEFGPEFRFFDDGDPGKRLVVLGDAGGFFLAEPNDRKNDHSDSNCTESNSLANGE